MCDYSLHHVASRPAKVGNEIVTTRFPGSTTRGFSAPGEPGVAVCLMPGTEVAFDRDVECERALRLLPDRKVGGTVARFRQVNMDQHNAHHDALEFPDGQVVLVTSLSEGQRATVLQLPAQPTSGEEPKAREEVREAQVRQEEILPL